MFMRMHRFIAGCLIVSLLAAAGCGNTKEPLVAVEGIVKLDGNPLPDVSIEFMPSVDKPGAKHSTGTTDAAGHYTLTCSDGRPGAETGRFSVTVREMRRPAARKTDAAGNAPIRAGPRVHPKYSKSATTPLVNYEVSEEKRNIDISLVSNPP